MARVLIFDSGVGGLSIMQAIHAKIPEQQLIFASDNEAYPYGMKAEKELIERVVKVVNRLIETTQADILIVACNTASTVVLPILRQQLTIPVVGVVPAIKPAAQLTKSRHIGILATHATVSRTYTFELIKQFAGDCQVELIGSNELVNLAEQKMKMGYVELQAIYSEVKAWLEEAKFESIDTIVLACTHFPLLQPELNQLFVDKQREIQWVDSALSIAKRVDFLLKEAGLESAHETENRAFFTQHFQTTALFDSFLSSLGVEQINLIDIVK